MRPVFGVMNGLQHRTAGRGHMTHRHLPGELQRERYEDDMKLIQNSRADPVRCGFRKGATTHVLDRDRQARLRREVLLA
jgi:hypothetical protein